MKLTELGVVPDRYTRQARLKPALLILLPAFIAVAVWLPTVWSILGGLTALVTACGLTFLLGELARYQGRRVQKRMEEANQGKFTTILLRHRDSSISSSTKQSYHDFIRTTAKRRMPTLQEEQDNPADADDCYAGAADWLLEATRDEKKYGLVKEENISYGFRRNLLGLKAPALLVVLASIAVDTYMTTKAYPTEPTRFWVGAVVSLCTILVGLVWLAIIRMPFVEDAGRAYAVRLLAQCNSIPKARSTRTSVSV